MEEGSGNILRISTGSGELPLADVLARIFDAATGWHGGGTFDASGIGQLYSEVHEALLEEPLSTLGEQDLGDETGFERYRTVRKHGFPEFAGLASRRVVVSLTSFPERIGCVASALASIYSQTLQADEVVLWLAKEQFPGGEDDLPVELRQLMGEGRLTVGWCQDLKPHKKYLYSFERYPNDLVVTVDDDLLYDPRMLERLVESYLLFPDAVSAVRAHLIAVGEDGAALPYESWVFETDSCIHEPSMQLMATGGAGALYPPRILDARTLDENAIRENCLFADDIWLKAAELASGVPVVVASHHRDLKYVPGSQDTALWKSNRGGDAGAGENDRQLARVIPWVDGVFGEGTFARALNSTPDGCSCELGIEAYARHSKAKQDFLRGKAQDARDSKMPVLANSVTARLDIKNSGGEHNDVSFLDISDPKADLRSPAWFRKDGEGIGYTAVSGAGELSLRFSCVGSGTLKLTLRGMNVPDDDGKRIPIWVDFTSLEVDGGQILEEPVSVWHDHPFRYERSVSNGDVVTVTVAWRHVAERQRDELQAKLDAAEAELHDVKGRLEREKRDHERDVEQLTESTTWKAGRAITWLPRKVKDMRKG